MSTKTRDALIDALADLGSLYPDLRFGQLIEMVASLAAEVNPISATDLDDDQMLNTALDHARTRREQLKTEDNSLQEWHSPEFRPELLDVLHRVRERQGDRRFGHLVAQMATFSGSGIYDVEDVQLLAAARNYPVGYQEGCEAESGHRAQGPYGRCLSCSNTGRALVVVWMTDDLTKPGTRSRRVGESARLLPQSGAPTRPS